MPPALGMALGLFLVVVGAACRLVPHAPNAVPLVAITLFAAVRYPRKWAWIVPVLAMAVADAVINARYGTVEGMLAVSLTIYATYLVIALVGGPISRKSRIGASVLGSTFFFLTTNAAVWAFQRNTGVGLTFADGPTGLLQSYFAALPFYRNGLIADLIGTVVLFGAADLVTYLRPIVLARRAQSSSLDLS